MPKGIRGSAPKQPLAPHDPKTCPRCKQEKLASDFTPDKRKADGRYTFCKTCMNKISRLRNSNTAYAVEILHELRAEISLPVINLGQIIHIIEKWNPDDSSL